MVDKYCKNCGTRVDFGDRFCANCGESVVSDDDQYDDDGGWSGTDVDRDADFARPTGQDTTLALLTHVLAFFTWVVGPLIVLLVTEDEFAKENARNALNWQIMLAIYMLISLMLAFVVIGIPLLLLFPALNAVFCVVAAIKASEGEAWRYPVTPDLL